MDEARFSVLLRSSAWLLFVAGLCVIIVGGSMAGLQAYEVGRVSGQAVLLLLPATLIAFLAIRMVGNRHLVGTLVGVGYVISCTILLGIGVQQASAERGHAEALVQDVTSFAAAQARQAAGTQDVRAVDEPLPMPRSDDSQFERARVWFARVAQRTSRRQGELQRAVRESKLVRLFDSQAITSREARKSMWTELDALEAAIDRFESALASDLKAAERDAGMLLTDPLRRDAVLAGFRESVSKQTPITKQWLAVERDFVGTARDLLEFLNSAEPSLRDGKLLFATDRDITSYNNYVAHLREIAAVEQSLLNEQVTYLNNAAEGLKNAVSAAL